MTSSKYHLDTSAISILIVFDSLNLVPLVETYSDVDKRATYVLLNKPELNVMCS